MTISGAFERFQNFNFHLGFQPNENLFSKNWSTVFQFKALRLKTHHFHTKLRYWKPILRQIEWWVQNGPTSKNGILPVTASFFSKFCFSFRTSYKVLIWCTNNPNVHIHTFCKHWSFNNAFSLRVPLMSNLQHIIFIWRRRY